MATKQQVLTVISDFFIQSGDFNGIPLTKAAKSTKLPYIELVDRVAGLVIDGLVTVQNGINPHIIGTGYLSTQEQLAVLDQAKENTTRVLMELPGGVKIESESHTVCAYPTRKHLEIIRDISEFQKRPFTCELALGEPQLKPAFFHIEVLERYFKDPRYDFDFDDYSGSISYLDHKDKPTVLPEQDQFFLKTFGLGTDAQGGRVAAVFLRYLSDLTDDHQLYWQSKQIQKGCQLLREYYENTIQGNWKFSYSVFSAFVEEQRLVNAFCQAAFGLPLFQKTFTEQARPKEFTFFLIPTLENFNNFILLLDKMISDNLNKAFFKDKIELYDLKEIEPGVVERKEKGTLRMLEEWLNKIYTTSDGSSLDDVFKPFKEVRKQRQQPAHRINENYYDAAFTARQKEMMKEVFYAMRSLRYIFQSHRASKSVKIPNWLENEPIKIF